MDDFYSPQKRGGVIASKIEHQDTVGVIFATELLDKNSKYGNFDRDDKPWIIVPEGNDDLEVLFKEDRIFIQVKSARISKKNDLEKIFASFKQNLQMLKDKDLDIQAHFVLYALSGLGGKLEGFDIKLTELLNGIGVYEESEIKSRKINLLNQYNISLDYSEILEHLEVRTQGLFKDSEEVTSIFNYKLRKSYNIRDFGDKLLDKIFKELLEKFAEGRRTRKPIRRKEFLVKIHSIIKENEFWVMDDLMIQTGYSKTSIGYEKIDKSINRELQKQINKSKKNITRQWKKEYWFAGTIGGFLAGNWKKCASCGHPMMANLGGLGGIACPDCGYQPYVTLFLGCSCGNSKMIKKQPALTGEGVFEAVREYFVNNSSECDNCNKEMLDDYWKFRIMLLPFPYPIKEYTQKLKEGLSTKTLIIKIIILIMLVYLFIFFK
ncbi:hypothetical protein IMZ78_00950 [Bacillus anthracis]|uniref:hypothetical protein n=1 Tax=Bacillus anthracis TaxID=1392 RepID=UPI001866D519|nr:hypothetical protein [Bacillus anthracis]MBE3640893.1 hypothetical protein [Bacillus anthracis]MDA1755590.1 hypothetical protein [Bacillus cereus]MDA2122133.1 hypothetical protein [Bacillus cereus]